MLLWILQGPSGLSGRVATTHCNQCNSVLSRSTIAASCLEAAQDAWWPIGGSWGYSGGP
jgi:hypothetical protein